MKKDNPHCIRKNQKENGKEKKIGKRGKILVMMGIDVDDLCFLFVFILNVIILL